MLSIYLRLYSLFSGCRLKDFTLKYGSTFRTKSKCEVIKTSTNRDTPGKCARFTCYHLGNVFNWKVGDKQHDY